MEQEDKENEEKKRKWVGKGGDGEGRGGLLKDSQISSECSGKTAKKRKNVAQ